MTEPDGIEEVKKRDWLLSTPKFILIMFFLGFIGFVSVGGITSNELDDICATNDRLVKRVGGQWGCYDSASIYGSMFNYSANDTAWNFPITAPNIYYNLTGLAEGNTNGITYTSGDSGSGSYLTVPNTAVVDIDFHVSFAASGGDALYGIAAVQNFDVNNNRQCYARRWAKKGQVGNVGSTCTMSLSANDTISLQVENEDNTRDIKVHTVSIKVTQIND